MPPRLPPAPFCVLIVLVTGCSNEPSALGWKVTTADEAIVAAARGFEGEIRRDECDGPIVHSDQFRDSPATPAPLPEGRYAFVVRARNASCEIVGRGCQVVELPTQEECAEVVLTAGDGALCPDGTLCDDGMCIASADAGLMDSAIRDGGDGGSLDSGSPDGSSDADACAPGLETCNGLDDDCNGVIDDGAAECAVETGCGFITSESGSAYLLCRPGLPWLEARTFCQMHGYDLAVIDNLTEQAFLVGVVASQGGGDWWIGLRDANDDGIYADDEWTGAPSGYRNWKSGHGDQAGDCAEMGSDGLWEEKGCALNRPFICEASPP